MFHTWSIMSANNRCMQNQIIRKIYTLAIIVILTNFTCSFPLFFFCEDIQTFQVETRIEQGLLHFVCCRNQRGFIYKCTIRNSDVELTNNIGKGWRIIQCYLGTSWSHRQQYWRRCQHSFAPRGWRCFCRRLPPPYSPPIGATTS